MIRTIFTVLSESHGWVAMVAYEQLGGPPQGRVNIVARDEQPVHVPFVIPERSTLNANGAPLGQPLQETGGPLLLPEELLPDD